MDFVSDLKMGKTVDNTVDGAVEPAETVVSTVPGKTARRRVSTVCKSTKDGQLVSLLVEEYEADRLLSRKYEQHQPYKNSCLELFEPDGSLISSTTERVESDGRITQIHVRGTGKSSTTRIISGEIEARATERSLIIETPEASHSYQLYDGKWTSFYKSFDLKLELKADFLKGPDSVLRGPDGINLVFRDGRLIDLIITRDIVSGRSEPGSGIIE